MRLFGICRPRCASSCTAGGRQCNCRQNWVGLRNQAASMDVALAVTQALAEIRRCAGKQFDPAVAAAFLKMAEGWSQE